MRAIVAVAADGRGDAARRPRLGISDIAAMLVARAVAVLALHAGEIGRGGLAHEAALLAEPDRVAADAVGVFVLPDGLERVKGAGVAGVQPVGVMPAVAELTFRSPEELAGDRATSVSIRDAALPHGHRQAQTPQQRYQRAGGYRSERDSIHHVGLPSSIEDVSVNVTDFITRATLLAHWKP